MTVPRCTRCNRPTRSSYFGTCPDCEYDDKVARDLDQIRNKKLTPLNIEQIAQLRKVKEQMHDRNVINLVRAMRGFKPI